MLRLFFIPFFLLVLFDSSSLGQTFTILSYNIRYDNPGDGQDGWSYRKQALANEVMRSQPDVIGLQEVLSQQLTYLKVQWPSYAYFGVGREDGMDKGEFAPIFYDKTRFNLLTSETLWLSDTPLIPSKGWDAALERIITMVQLQDIKSKENFWVINSHWDHEGSEARFNSAKKIAELCKLIQERGERAIVMGDFNCQPTEAPIQYLQNYLKDACPQKLQTEGTFNAFKVNPPNPPHIDYIFLSPKMWKKKSFEIAKPLTADGRQVSDHYPVVAQVKIKNLKTDSKVPLKKD